MQAAILNGLSRSQTMVEQQVPIQCPSGICTWDRFQTLGVCHRCSDLSSDLKRVDGAGKAFEALREHEPQNDKNDNATAFFLPDGHLLVNINGCSVSDSADSEHCRLSPNAPESDVLKMTSFGTGSPEKTNRMQDLDTLIWSTSVIHFDGRGDWPDLLSLRAAECAVYCCIKTIDFKVEGNVIHENVTEAKATRSSFCGEAEVQCLS